MQHKLAFIAPYKKLGEIFNEVAYELNKDIPVYIGDLEQGAKKAEELEGQGIDVIISRGGTAIAIESRLTHTPVVGVHVSGFDLIRIIYQAKMKTDRIAVVGFDPFTSGIKQLGDIMDIDLKVVTIRSEWHDQPLIIKEKLMEIKGMDYHWLVGDNISVKIAKDIGMNSLLIRSGKEALSQAISKAEEIASVRKKEKQKAKQHKSIIDFAYEGIISIDNKGIITTFNPKAEQIFDRESYKVIGKDIGDVLPDFNLKQYIDTRHREQGKILNVGGNKIAANIIPILVEGNVYGVVATFQKVSNIQKVEEKVREELYLKGYTAKSTFDDIIGESELMLKSKEEARDYAQVDLPLLIFGETGTGKELFAQSIHNCSPRRNKPFVAFNCATLPEKLLESELFGYVEGAFTGAHKEGRKGLLEQAHEGTLFLDEIGEISLNLQARLLRFLEERKIRKLGDNKLTPVNVRIILATNKSLAKMVRNNEFREDFYYRINVLNLDLPPLRKRKSDIPLLVDFFIKKANSKINRMVSGISERGLELLKNYRWPGNVRQLENVIEKLVIRTRQDYIMTDLVKETIDSLKIEEARSSAISEIEPEASEIESENRLSISLDKSLEEMEREIIKKVVEKEQGNKSLAAEKLQIGRTTLWRKLKEIPG